VLEQHAQNKHLASEWAAAASAIGGAEGKGAVQGNTCCFFHNSCHCYLSSWLSKENKMCSESWLSLAVRLACSTSHSHVLVLPLAGSQSSLVELLEVPQLMDTCVRNGVYDEALDLQAFVSRMGLLHPEVPLIKLLLAQVSLSMSCLSCILHHNHMTCSGANEVAHM
jgi:hypothetical protein